MGQMALDGRRKMQRRTLMSGLLGLSASSVRAQDRSLKRLAIVSPTEPAAIMIEDGPNPYYRVLFNELRSLGHVEGKTLTVERYSRENAASGLETMIAEVVRSRPNVIYAIGGGPLLKAATTSIPVVVLTYDPIALGLAKTVARPGGNFTGVSVDTGPALYGKRIELLREVAPGVTRFGFLTSRRIWDLFQGKVVRGAAEAAGVEISPFLVDLPATVDQYRRAVLAARADGVGAIIIGDSPEALQYRQEIVRAVAETGLPAMYTFPESVEAGGLIAYAFDLKELNQRSARDIDAILRGADPGEIPFYQLTRLILSVNTGTAKSLGIRFPPAILGRADEVIE